MGQKKGGGCRCLCSFVQSCGGLQGFVRVLGDLDEAFRNFGVYREICYSFTCNIAVVV